MEFFTILISNIIVNWVFFACFGAIALLYPVLLHYILKVNYPVRKLIYLGSVEIFALLTLFIDYWFVHWCEFTVVQRIYYGLILGFIVYAVANLINDILLPIGRYIKLKKDIRMDIKTPKELDEIIANFTREWIKNKGQKTRSEYIQFTRDEYISKLTHEIQYNTMNPNKVAKESYIKYSK